MLAAQAATANEAARAANETVNGALLQVDADANATAASVVASDQNIDPAIAGNATMMRDSGLAASPSNGEDEIEENGDGKTGYRRELSTSKRAAQNRAAQVRRSRHVACIDCIVCIDGEHMERSATVKTKRTPTRLPVLCHITVIWMNTQAYLIEQRAFRQRKEGYIKKLEEQVRDLHALEETFKVVQAENYQLRDYVINLQSRLIESQGDFPQPPSNIDLSQTGIPLRPDLPPIPVAPLPPGVQAPMAPMGSALAAASLLQASAAQAQVVADMANAVKQLKHDAAFPDETGPAGKRQKGLDGEVLPLTDPAMISMSLANEAA